MRTVLKKSEGETGRQTETDSRELISASQRKVISSILLILRAKRRVSDGSVTAIGDFERSSTELRLARPLLATILAAHSMRQSALAPITSRWLLRPVSGARPVNESGWSRSSIQAQGYYSPAPLSATLFGRLPGSQFCPCLPCGWTPPLRPRQFPARAIRQDE